MSRVVKLRKEKYDVYIGRPSKWRNLFQIEVDGNRKEVIELYERWITKGDGRHLLNDLHELKGKVLGCYCKPLLCHGDVLIRLINDRL